MKVTVEMAERAHAVLHCRGLLKAALLSDIVAALEVALEHLAEPDVCEVCKDCLIPEPPRCEKHAHTEPGDDEWEKYMEPRGEP